MANTKSDATGPKRTSAQQKAQWRLLNPKKEMVSHARRRAKALGLLFNLTAADFTIPEKCPILGIPLRVNAGKVGGDSPTLDRKVPALGYVAGNVWVISHRANAMKGTGSVASVMKLTSEFEEIV